MWPAAQAIQQAVLRSDPFGLRTRFVGLENFKVLFSDPYYLGAIRLSFLFAAAVTLIALSVALLLAVMAHRPLRGPGSTRPSSSGPTPSPRRWRPFFGCSCSSPRSGSWPAPSRGGDRLELHLERRPGVLPRRAGLGVEARELQLHLLPGRAPGDPEVPPGGGAGGWGLVPTGVLVRGLPPAYSDHVLPPRDEHGLLVHRHVRGHRRPDEGGRARPRRRWSTSCLWTGTRTSRSTALPPSPWS